MKSKFNFFRNEALKSFENEVVVRLNVIFSLLVVFFVLLVLRLVKVQIFDHHFYVKISSGQYFSEMKLQAIRGLIYDRNGRILATNVTELSIAVDPFYLKSNGVELSLVAELFSRWFGGSRSSYLEKLKSDKRFVILVNALSVEEGWRLDSLLNSFQKGKRVLSRGIIKIERMKRFYPYEKLAGQLIGALGRNGEALMGVEMKFDEILRGRDGFIRLRKDALGDLRATADRFKIDPVNGYSVRLTIDVEIQGIVEEELERGVKEFNAESGVAIVIDPKTGDILALANYPNFDPNRYWLYGVESFKNKAITDAFEPGSTFKIVPASLLLEKNPGKLNTKVDVENGEANIRGVRVIDFKPYKVLRFEDVIKFSSNIGMAKFGLELSEREFFKQIKNFGFGSFTGINLPGEEKGEVKPVWRWTPTTKVFMSFGYELRATPLQIALAYSAIANGGVLMQPRIADAIINEHGEVVKKFSPIKVRRIVSEKTAKILTWILEGVVNEGTGVQAKIEGVRIAGKTGTAQKYEAGIYSKSHYRASFVGFFPTDDPKYVCFVMVESPKGNYSGGMVSAPIFRRIAERIIDITGVKFETVEKVRKENFDAKAIEKEKDLKIDKGKMADLRGLSVREALEKISSLNLKVKIIGSGIVYEQFPPPNFPINGECVLYCREVTTKEISK